MMWIIVSLLSLQNPDHEQGYVGEENYVTEAKCKTALKNKFGANARKYRCVPHGF